MLSNSEKSKLAVIEKETFGAMCLIKAAEQWEEGYKTDKESFKLLVETEARMERTFTRYFKALSKRVPEMINWDAYEFRLDKTKVAFEVFVEVIDEAFEEELLIILNIFTDEVAAGMASGYIAQQNATNFNMSPARIETLIENAARIYSARQARGMNRTTRKRIASTIATSLRLGEPVSVASRRLTNVINDPKRAIMIARTESVNSYSLGTIGFGKESGATGKIWKTVQVGACPICRPLDQKKVKLDGKFNSIVGPLNNPAAHPNCRCRIVLKYPQS